MTEATTRCRPASGDVRRVHTVRAVAHALAVGVLVATGVVTHSAAAAEVADFYKGRTVAVVVGHETGTGYDMLERAKKAVRND
jgi:hypothetical protein